MDGLIKYTMFFGLVVFMIFSPKEPEESDSQEIVSIVEDFNNALIHLNKSGLKKMTSEDLSYGHSDGSVQDKNEFIEELDRIDRSIKTFSLLVLSFSGLMTIYIFMLYS